MYSIGRIKLCTRIIRGYACRLQWKRNKYCDKVASLGYWNSTFA